MSPPMGARRASWKILLPLLAATLGAVAWLEWGQGRDDEVAGALVRPHARDERTPALHDERRVATGEGRAGPQEERPTAPDGTAGELRIERVARLAASAAAGGDPFARADWNPPPPPPPPAAARREAVEPPPKPVAPPIPYAYFGMSIQDGRTVVFVTREQRTFVLAVGEVIENQYRVEEIRPPDAVLTYLPLNERQVMKIGTVQP